jgi:hypothetical protein
MQESDQQAPAHQREEPELPQLPRGHLKTALLIALIAGIIASAQTIVVTLINGGFYRQAAQFASNPAKLPVSTALTIFGLFLLTSIIGAVIYFIAGFITAKIAVSRRLGFLCGFVAGAITQLAGFFVQYLPNYPASVNSGVSGGIIGVGSGTITALVLLLIVALVAGLIAFLGSWLATRRHPYYAA